MERRGFLALIGMSLSTAAIPSTALVPDRRERLKAVLMPVCRANGCAYILGVATETVHAGDFVQIQVYGPASVNARIT